MKNKFCLSLLVAAFALPCLTGCNSEDTLVLRVLNMEDYIYLYEDGDLDYFPELENYSEERGGRNIYNVFAADMSKKYGKKVEVIYTTTATNESLYSELKTGKAQYDIVCPSDYMIQKLIYDDLLEKIDTSPDGNISAYFKGYDQSKHRFNDEQVIKNRLADIKAYNSKQSTSESVGDYAVGYMWGTLGILFNPDFKNYSKDVEDIFTDAKEWSMLWDKKYKGVSYIKNSMRDTYAVGTLETYKDELLKGLGGDFGKFSSYNELINDVLNRCDEQAVNEVGNKLSALKENCYGLETDNGKQDMVKGDPVGIDVAWSGDACYAISQAKEVDEDFQLYYSIPEVGANIWFDGWVMPKRSGRTEEEKLLAYDWLNYMSEDENVAKNVYYNGYTPFTTGIATVDIIRDSYDARTDYMYVGDESVYYYDPENPEEIIELGYEDFELDSDLRELDDTPCNLYYMDIDEKTGEGTECRFVDPFDEEVELTTKDISLKLFTDVHADEIQTVSFEYFFGADTYENTFYTYLYNYFDEDGNINASVGMDLFCFLPDEATIEKCAVMVYSPENNFRLIRMWEDFKSDPLPIWGVIILIASVVLIAFGFIAFLIAKKGKLALRKKRKQQ